MNHLLLARAEVPWSATWDLDSIFPALADWEAAFAQCDAALPGIAAFAGRLSEGPQTLAAFFAALENLQRLASQVSVYAGLGYAVDTTNADAAARADRAGGLAARTAAATAFAEPELLALGSEAWAYWLQESEALRLYAHYFDRLGRRAAHVRSADVEATLSQARDAFGGAAKIHALLCDADMVFAPAEGESGPVEIGQGNIARLLAEPDRRLRQSAWERYADAHLAHRNALAMCLATGVKQNVFLAKVRGYESALQASLEPNFIPVAVFDRLLEAFVRHLPVWHRYWAIRRRALQVERLAPWDVRAPLQGRSPEISYAQAVAWIADGMAPLGAEYVETMRRGATAERWVDAVPNKGKRMGAFSSGTVGTHPFILMSFNDDLFSLSTLAHELGHSMHSYYSRRTQPQVYAGYGLFVAEVASNFNQALVRAHLLERFADDPAVQVAVIEEAMSNFHRYFFVMPTLARFEQEIHARVWKGEALTARFLIERMAELFHEGFGPEVAWDEAIRERVGSTWMQFSTHLYANFYVYQYATGIAGAHALAARVLDEGEPAAEAYRQFLCAGGSDYPLSVLRRAGVDLESPEPVERAFATLTGYVDRLETLLASR